MVETQSPSVDPLKEYQDRQEFLRDLAAVLNKYSLDSRYNAPDFLLAEYLDRSMKLLDRYVTFQSDEREFQSRTYASVQRFMQAMTKWRRS